ncbi:MAG: DUF86 domain-containing protein [Gammaproteobacteria bacterium]|nr:DUF86 domain-containing protein [Gammaproteobacteria bacterium]MBU1972427.1 DUF86 domain-containing protein [Gammaproteobacteria bacterium]
MLEAIANVKSDVGDMSKYAFLGDGKTQRAAIESLIVIGEASNKIMALDPEIRQSAPSLWQNFNDACDMRIVLTHEYFRVDAAVVWTTIKNNLPLLEAQLFEFVAIVNEASKPTVPEPGK